MQKKSNYEIQAENAILSFPQWDHEKIAKKFNLNLDKDYLYIRIHRTKLSIKPKNRCY